MTYLIAGDDVVEPMRVDVRCGEPRFWLNGKPECGIFTLGELRAAWPNDDDLRQFLWASDRIAIDATRREA